MLLKSLYKSLSNLIPKKIECKTKNIAEPTPKNKNLSPRLKKLKKVVLIKSPFKKKTVAKSA